VHVPGADDHAWAAALQSSQQLKSRQLVIVCLQKQGGDDFPVWPAYVSQTLTFGGGLFGGWLLSHKQEDCFNFKQAKVHTGQGHP
jgi:hypothetical protein